MTTQEYVNNVTTRQSLYSKITPTENYYVLNGEKKTPEEIDQLFPVVGKIQPSGLRYKGQNSNKSVNWMNDEKSY